MTSLLPDVRQGFRVFRANPGFVATAILTLALGIGANSAIFSVVNGVLLRPLSYPEPDRIVAVWPTSAGTLRETLTPAGFLDLEPSASSGTSIA